VTATVENVSLIAASIMSKKLAAGADAIVLDVKIGDGAFMKTEPAARELAHAMTDLGRRAGREVVCLLTDMDQPLGRAVGNALEIREAVATVRGEGPADFTQLVLDAATQLVALSDLQLSEEEARARVEEAVQSGSALQAYRRWIAAQGGDADEAALPRAGVVRDVTARRDGWVNRLSAMGIGVAALELGAGRRTKEDSIQHEVGVVCLAKRGDAVRAGTAIAEVHAGSDEDARRAAEQVEAAYTIGAEQPPPQPIVLDVIR
jgi:pyrimidine-nucleoside phosphorylase